MMHTTLIWCKQHVGHKDSYGHNALWERELLGCCMMCLLELSDSSCRETVDCTGCSTKDQRWAEKTQRGRALSQGCKDLPPEHLHNLSHLRFLSSEQNILRQVQVPHVNIHELLCRMVMRSRYRTFWMIWMKLTWTLAGVNPSCERL